MESVMIVNFVLSLAALGASITAYRAISKVRKDQETWTRCWPGRPTRLAGPYPAGSVPGVMFFGPDTAERGSQVPHRHRIFLPALAIV